MITPQPALVGLAQEHPEIAERAVIRMDSLVVSDVVAVVLQRRGIERQQPQGADAQVLQIVELARQPAKIADAVGISVKESPDVKLVDDRVPVPQRIRILHKLTTTNGQEFASGACGAGSVARFACIAGRLAEVRADIMQRLAGFVEKSASYGCNNGSWRFVRTPRNAATV